MKEQTILNFLSELEECYPKLVRDKIPEIIIKNEGSPAKDVRTIDNSEVLLKYAIKKVLEESGELYVYKDTNEIIAGLGDLYELFDLIKDITKISDDSINEYRVNKNIKVGSFKKKLVLFEK